MCICIYSFGSLTRLKCRAQIDSVNLFVSIKIIQSVSALFKVCFEVHHLFPGGCHLVWSLYHDINFSPLTNHHHKPY